MRWLKIFAIAFGVLVVIIAGALFWVSTQDFSKYQSVIADEVRQATGRELKINGKFEVKVGLSPSLRVNDVSFQNVSWGSRPELGKFKQLDVELQLIPLIFGDIKVNRIVLSGADILLETDKQGRNNWDFATNKPAAGQPTAGQPQQGKGSLPQIDKLTITDSLVTIRNAQTGRNMVVAVKSLDVTGIGGSGTTRLDLDGRLNDNPLSVKAGLESLFAMLNGGDGMLDVSVKAGASQVSMVGPVRAGAPAGVKIVAQGDNLASLKPLIGAALPPLGPYSLDGKLSGAGKDAYRLDVAKLKVGSTEIAGTLAIASEGGKPKLTADLSSPRVNAQDFLKEGKTASGGSGGSGKDDGRVFPNDPLPVDDLRLANAVLTLKAGELVNDEVKMSNLVFPLTLQNGRLAIKPTATVSGGSVVIDMTLDASGATPQFALALQGNNVNVGDLLKMLQNSDAISGGPATIDIRVRGAGNSVRAIMASLSGSSSVAMGRGVLNNKRIAFLSADFLKLLTGGGSTSEIHCAVSRFTIVNGVATSEALVFDATNLSARGSGTINLGSEALNLLIHPETKQPALASLAVPIRITGTLANPSANPDLAQGVLEAPKNVLGTVGKAGGSVLGTITGGKVGNSGGSSGSSAGCGPVAAAPPPGNPPPAAPPDGGKKPAPAPKPAPSSNPLKKLFN